MAIGHISIRVHTRSKGHSAAAGIAYRMGVDLVDPRTGVEHLYARRTKYGDIVDCGMADAGAFGDVAALAAAIEAAEKRRNSSLMRDVQVALPCELEEDQCTSLTAEFAALLAQRYRTHTAWSVHRPDKRADARNQHGHIVVPTRELVNGVFGRKLRILDDHKTGRVEVAEIRKLWERTANTHLARAGHTARVDVSRREDGNPVPTLGRGCTAIEREAAVERGELVENRSVADLVSTGSAVTWRGRALRRHQLRERQKARQEERAQSTAPEDEVATIAVTEAQPQAQAAPIRVSFGAPSMARPAGGRRAARAQAVATPARIDLKQREASGRRALRIHTVQAHTVAKPVTPCTPARRLEGAAVREVREQAVAAPARIDLQPRRTSRRGGWVPPSALIAARVRQEPSVTPAQPRTRTRMRTVSSPVELRVAQPAASATPVRLEMRSRPAAGPLARPSATRAQPILRGTDSAQPTPAQPRTRTRTVGSPVELRVAQPAASATPVRLEMRSRPAAGPLARPPAAVAAPVHPRPTPIPTERLALPELATTWDAAEEAVRTFPDLPFGQVVAEFGSANLKNLCGADVGVDIVAKAEEIQTREESQPPYLFEEMLDEFLQWLQEKLEEMFRLVGLHKEAAAREKQDAEARDPRFHTPPASGRELKLHGHADAAIKARRPEPHRGVRGGDAQNNRGGMYEFGRGVPQDYGEAVRWYRLAADQGHASAQRNLGGMYADGRGVPQDDVAAHMWANLAAAQGDETARELRDYLSERMSSGQIAAAQRAAREWRPAFQSR